MTETSHTYTAPERSPVFDTAAPPLFAVRAEPPPPPPRRQTDRERLPCPAVPCPPQPPPPRGRGSSPDGDLGAGRAARPPRRSWLPSAGITPGPRQKRVCLRAPSAAGAGGGLPPPAGTAWAGPAPSRPGAPRSPHGLRGTAGGDSARRRRPDYSSRRAPRAAARDYNTHSARARLLPARRKAWKGLGLWRRRPAPGPARPGGECSGAGGCFSAVGPGRAGSRRCPGAADGAAGPAHPRRSPALPPAGAQRAGPAAGGRPRAGGGRAAPGRQPGPGLPARRRGQAALMSAFSPAAGNGSAGQILPGHPRGTCRGVPSGAGRCPGPPRPATRSSRPRPSPAPRGGHGRGRKRRRRRLLRPVPAERLRRRLPGRAGKLQRGPDGGPGGLLHERRSAAGPAAAAGPLPVSARRGGGGGRRGAVPDGVSVVFSRRP